ncbi:hypothetical protein FHW67_000899 [Herbaspirillum sp. Sphag1AN]|uniref:hypothetical protein n=1 Tax=unclassified Herbaspirillum TaxID=2624150 RepID=UPI00161E229D|nr:MULTISPECIES: hypothetical protein [unclassified Herbaspirillum]MBB3211651.1 hypothetical protein [Herbaspirillum sp. Sphag1AN]MBB3245081.1 hypothetical protein [Herbaspirillum sp. Sphag64]
MNTIISADVVDSEQAKSSVNIDSSAEQLEGQQYVVLTQVKSYRVVYFTTDPQYVPPMEGDWYFASTYQGVLPQGMTLQNCWAWRFNGNTFVHAGDQARKNKTEEIIETNKRALKNILRDKIQRLREPYLPSDSFGYELRARKRQEAKLFLEQPDAEATYPYLEATAVARNLTMHDAARLILWRAEKTEKVMISTERVRERFSLLVEQADSQEKLLTLRSMLLEELYPELSKEFRYNISNTIPMDHQTPLSEQALVHEKSRLRAMLLECINELRGRGDNRYLQNEKIVIYKAKLAKIIKSRDAPSENKLDVKFLDEIAIMWGKDRGDLAKLWMEDLINNENLLLESEKEKENFMYLISKINCLSDVRRIEENIFNFISYKKNEKNN